MVGGGHSIRGACLAGTLLILAVGLLLQADRSGAAVRRCAPVVSRVGPGLTKAWVLIVDGRVDCEKARRVIFKALFDKPYERRRLRGWDCRSTKDGRSGVYGARCTRAGEKEDEVIKSTLPQRCPKCRKVRD